MIVVQERKGYLIAKRLMDIIGTLMGIILFSLVMILVAILIKLEDPRGKVLFKQARIGKSGKLFQIYKFRSMSADAEEKLEELLPVNEASGAIFKIRNDPRVTKVGKWIRRMSIDELPQIWNVLKGDMSLVGPRPPLPREVKEYSEFDKQRLLVTPGCTGLWQISGRGRLEFEEMLALDLKYIQKRSITTDIGIIVKTFGLLFKGY
ncbi:sugar transferase [Cohnella nanjingensis]|uniref:Sugar transferase n=1 Tax=Cohnella nanjingensis TaxID=1387779 RepID=A0A7X0RVV3_9BACL|nr:sugar transferase [Cohnella nanjingensis]MBB6673426.1 sugar transferase [Cohnella nanjingensis]